jgi:hypothetical protein
MRGFKTALTSPFWLLAASLLIVACSGTPAIVVEPPAIDFGDIGAVDPVTGSLLLRNAGQGTLRLSDIRTSCGCTTATTGAETLAPGEQTELVVTFDPQAHDGLYGPLLRMVYIKSNDPDSPDLEIPVTVNVLNPEEARP